MPEITHGMYRAGEGEPVVLLHGFTATWHCWKPILADLVPRYEVIAPTLAGHDGGPEYPADLPLTIEAATDSIEGHLDDIGIETAHFVGNSMGGGLAIELARRGRARSVVGISPAGGWEVGSTETARLRKFFKRQLAMTRASNARLPMVMKRPGSRRLALRDAMRHGELVAPADAIDLARASLRCSVVDQVLTALGTGGTDVVVKNLDEITTPVLLAWAEHDRILPKETCSSRYRREIPSAQYRVLPGVGHVPMWDDSRLIADTVISWVDQHTAVPAASA